MNLPIWVGYFWCGGLGVEVFGGAFRGEMETLALERVWKKPYGNSNTTTRVRATGPGKIYPVQIEVSIYKWIWVLVINFHFFFF